MERKIYATAALTAHGSAVRQTRGQLVFSIEPTTGKGSKAQDTASGESTTGSAGTDP